MEQNSRLWPRYGAVFTSIATAWSSTHEHSRGMLRALLQQGAPTDRSRVVDAIGQFNIQRYCSVAAVSALTQDDRTGATRRTTPTVPLHNTTQSVHTIAGRGTTRCASRRNRCSGCSAAARCRSVLSWGAHSVVCWGSPIPFSAEIARPEPLSHYAARLSGEYAQHSRLDAQVAKHATTNVRTDAYRDILLSASKCLPGYTTKWVALLTGIFY
jgi:hypothetical protein